MAQHVLDVNRPTVPGGVAGTLRRGDGRCGQPSRLSVMSSHDASFGPDPAAAPPLRWGILGPGGIARRFSRDIPAHTASSVVAVGSRCGGCAEAVAADAYDPTEPVSPTQPVAATNG